MQALQPINADSLGMPAGHYSHAICAGGMAYISGQLPVTAQGQPLTGAPFEVQVDQVLENLGQVLAACGCQRQHLVQVRIYLCDIALWPSFNQQYARWLGSHRPARCVVPVPELHYGLALEIEAIALLPMSEG